MGKIQYLIFQKNQKQGLFFHQNIQKILNTEILGLHFHTILIPF
jgi:hypothetical protein